MLLRKSLIVLITLFPLLLSAQEPDTLITKIFDRLEKNSIAQPGPAVYLHIDKNIYVHNENIWFTAYLINGNPADEHTMHVLLIDQVKKKIAANERFVMRSGMSQGYLFLRDTIEAGEYQLIAYTNTLSEHPQQQVFRQLISLRPSKSSPFAINDLSEAPTNPDDSLLLHYKVITAQQGLASGGSFRYCLYTENEGLDSGQVKIDEFGEVLLKYAPLKDHNKELTLLASVKYKNQTNIRRFTVKQVNPFSIHWYPEGGNLVNGHTATTALEITNNGQPVSMQGNLAEDGKLVAGFTTDKYGTARLIFTPHANSHYTVISDELKMPVNTELPVILPTGFSLHIENAIVNDTLTIQIQPPTPGANCYIVLHNYKEAFYTSRITLRGSAASGLKIPVTGLPRGVATVTLFDDRGIPEAERAFVVHHQQQLRVAMQTDSATYHTRSKVQLNITVTDENGQPVRSVFSLSCVAGKRIDSTRFPDITRYALFDQYLPKKEILPPWSYFNNDQHLDLVLLTRFWTRYRWNTMQQNIPGAGSLDAGIKGDVLFRRKKLKNPLPITIASEESVNAIFTDSTGHFSIPHEYVEGPAESRVMISIAKPGNYSIPEDYSIFMEDGLESLNKNLAAVYLPATVQKEDFLTAEEKIAFRSMLATVTVKAKKDDDIMMADPTEFKSTTCRDYVCFNNILNCRNHRSGGTKPLDGTYYIYNDPMKGVMQVRYSGCSTGISAKQESSFIQKIHATYYTKEFYVADYAKFNPPDPEINTTVHWMHGAVTDDKGRITIPFYTNDLTGNFLCIVEGISDVGFLSGRATFNVN